MKGKVSDNWERTVRVSHGSNTIPSALKVEKINKKYYEAYTIVFSFTFWAGHNYGLGSYVGVKGCLLRAQGVGLFGNGIGAMIDSFSERMQMSFVKCPFCLILCSNLMLLCYTGNNVCLYKNLNSHGGKVVSQLVRFKNSHFFMNFDDRY